MIFDELKKYDIVLASASPRRQELLKQLGLDFRVELRPVEESYPEGLTGEEIALFLSKLKSDAFDAEFFTAGRILITADTVVCLGDEVLGKPSGREEAVATLRKLSGRKHCVITAVCLTKKSRQSNFPVCTDVYFKTLSEEEITYYVDHYKPYDKAGAYGIQEWIGYIGIERISGSFYNVMGLPVGRLYEELQNF